MAMLNKIKKINEQFTVNRYDNGFMIELSGRDVDNEWKTIKLLCNTQEELVAIILEALAIEKDE